MNEHEDLDLLAFRYIAAEMTAAEAEAFELRLADDQAAREAVARAVELAQAVACTRQETIPLHRNDRSPLGTDRTRSASRLRRTVRWMVAAAASVAICVFGYQAIRHPSEAKTLAKLWAKARIGQDWTEPDGELLADLDDAMADDDSDVAVPAWLIEAVQGADSDKWEDS